MVQSFTAEKTGALAKKSNKRGKVLVTGAAGRIGSYFAEHSHDRYDLRLMVQGTEEKKKLDALKKWGEVVEADLADLDRMKQICKGIDTVVHLAANPDPDATWVSLRDDNITG